MLRVLRAELSYGAWFLMPSVLVPLTYLYELWNGETTGFLIVLFALLAINTVFTVRSKEHRERYMAVLPVPRVKLALVRLLLVLIPGGATFGLYAILNLVYPVEAAFSSKLPIVGFGMILMAYSVAFLLKDTFPDLISRRATALMVIALAGGLFMSFLGVVVFIKSRGTGPPVFIRSMIDAFRTYNPFGGAWGPLRFLGFALLLAALTIVTYRRRRSFATGAACSWPD